MSTLNLEGKKVLVTGSGTGIGREIALEFGRQGADVFLHFAHDQEFNGAESATRHIESMGHKASFTKSDFSLDGAANTLTQIAAEFLDGLDVIVNNAGVTFNQRLGDMTEEQFNFLSYVNVRAQLFTTKAALPTMIEQGEGCIINLSSVHAYQGMVGHAAYAATKGAIVAMTRALAVELSQRNIRVNAIAPGWIETENQHQVMEFDAKEEGKKIPIGRLGRPSDIAKLATWLASDNASYITGQTIVMDGGLTCPIQATDTWQAGSDAPFGRPYVPGI